MRSATPSPRSVAALRAALQDRLQRRARQLMDEVRCYPGPIARCDEQLSALLEHRSIVFRALERLEPGEAQTLDEDAASLAMLEDCLQSVSLKDEDDALAGQLAALREAWRAARGGCGPVDAWMNDGGGSPCAA